MTSRPFTAEAGIRSRNASGRNDPKAPFGSRPPSRSPAFGARVGEMPETFFRSRPGIFGVEESRLQLVGIATVAFPDESWPLVCDFDDDELPPVEWPTKNPITPSTT